MPFYERQEIVKDSLAKSAQLVTIWVWYMAPPLHYTPDRKINMNMSAKELSNKEIRVLTVVG